MAEQRGTAVATVGGDLPTIFETQHLTERGIQLVARDIELAEELCRSVLKEGIDYGQTPGTQGKGLWDAGASKIIRAFMCHAEHKVIFHEDDENIISWTIESRLMSAAGEIVGSGMGTASTRESKYKYRWVPDPDKYDYTPEEIAGLKTRMGYDNKTVLYRIENPEYGELVNTLLQMACKRGEVDAARSLPGVQAILKVIFDPKLARQQVATNTPSDPEKPDFKGFWTEMHAAGLTDKSVHNALGVTKLEEYLAKGKTLQDARVAILSQLVTLVKKKTQPEPSEPKAETKVEPKAEPVTPPPVTPPPAPVAAPAPRFPAGALMVTSKHVKTWDDFFEAAKLYWNLTEQAAIEDLGYKSRENIEEAGLLTPYTAFNSLFKERSNQ
jgi:hypothetical protein